MIEMIAVPRYLDDIVIAILSCRHGRLVSKDVGRAALDDNGVRYDWCCLVCGYFSHIIDVIERKP
jgi:hypothetical protein